jgi:hypothetical protein
MKFMTEKYLLEIERRDIYRHCIMIGKLDQREGKEISQNFRNQVAINIQPLCEEPAHISQDLGKDFVENYYSYDDKNTAFLKKIKYYDKTSAQEKVDFLYEYLRNKLILFKPKLSERIDGGAHFHFEILQVSDDVVEDSYYYAVPKVTGLSAARFDKALLERRPFRLPMYSNLFKNPEFITCEKYVYLIQEDSFENIQNNRTTYYCKDSSIIKKIRMPDDWSSQIKGVLLDLAYIPSRYASELRDLFNSLGVPPGSDDLTPIYTSPQYIEDQIKKNAELETQIVEDQSNPHFETNSDQLKEFQFIQKLKYLALKDKLVYKEYDLFSFHTALKTSMLTILGGMSGTGKTRLARLYAKALDLKNDVNLLIVPISPSYTEPSDLLGYLNQQLGIYMESETGLVSFLQHAAENEKELHMIIFDEMNLGQVEHYFAPFLSLMEMEEEERYLTLFSKNSICRDRIPQRIKIGENLIMVGTANFDETTKDFSKRLLDRTNVILLDKQDFIETNNHVKTIEEEEPTADVLNQSISTSLFRSVWTNKHKEIYYLTPDEIELLDKIHLHLRSIDAQTGVSFRIANGISIYLSNLPSDETGQEFMSRDTALDFQIKQRILTKIRGHREQIEHLVGTYDLGKDKYEPSDLAFLLGGDDWKMEHSFEYLKQKAKELTRNGYTL